MMEWEEYKRKKLIGTFNWYIEELRRFKEEKKGYILDNLIGCIKDEINRIDKPMYFLWFYYERNDTWVQAIGSFDRDNLEKYANDDAINRGAKKWKIFKENENIESGMNDEVMEYILNLIERVRVIKNE
jgi:predicted metal-dependent phosphoesterase TrpH